MHIEHHLIIEPLLQDLEESGDLAIVKEDENYYYFGLIDGLGHGKKANIASKAAIEYLENNFSCELDELIVQINKELQGSIGVVLALCCINKKSGETLYSGIGNITVRHFGKNPFKCIPRDGIVGYSMPTPKMQKFNLHPGDLLLMYSDGVQEHFDLLEQPGLRNEPVVKIAETLIDAYSKSNDDVSLITCKVK